MPKNKVIVFGVHGAKIFVTDNPESFACEPEETLLINPDLSYVVDVPPEFWTLDEAGVIKPLFDAVEIKKRASSLGTKTLINAQVKYVQDQFSNVVEIPAHLDILTETVIDRMNIVQKSINDSKKELFDEIRDMQSFVNEIIWDVKAKMNVFNKLNSDLDSKRFKVLVAIQIICFVLLGAAIYFA